MNEKLLKNYAGLIVAMGVNVEKGQTVIIACDTESAYFGRMVAQAAYERGAREVVFDWTDDQVKKLTYMNADDGVFDEYPEWRVAFYDHYDSVKAAYIRIVSSDPELLRDVPSDRISRSLKITNIKTKKHRDLSMSSAVRWSIAAVPGKAWAKKVFPALEQDKAVEELWKAIAKAARVDGDDPIEAWHEHNAQFVSRADFLNKHQFKYLKLKNSLGTDLTMHQPDNHIWAGGGENCRSGKLFFPNIPTEEIFTAPKKDGINGRIVASMPLNYQGNLIEGIDITFVDGKAVDCRAASNEELLKSIVTTDEGAAYLGEIALVPHNSPISGMNLLFYNTLFDENAACHVAIGKGYPNCIANAENMTDDELKKAGLNDSFVHVDFMFGTADMEIIAVDDSGNEVKIISDGNYVI